MSGVVVGVDGSADGATALVWAQRFAARRGQELTALLGWDYLDQHHPDGSERFEPDYGEHEAAKALDAYVEGALDPEVARSVQRRVVLDNAAQALVDASTEAGLLVVGARGMGRFRGTLVGSVSQRCAQHARCPVTIVRGTIPADAPGRDARIVVGVDGSNPSRRALHWAVEEALVSGASVDAIHAWSPFLGGEPFYSSGVESAAVEAREQAVLDEAVDAEDTSDLVRPIQRILALGDPAGMLIDAAQGADLLVVGSRGRGGFAGLLLGSVSQKAIHHAPCPVVVMPTETAD
jgi:nucleotide-binding universal stress UspA family protein